MAEPPLAAAQVIALLGLQPHMEGGHFRETYRHRPDSDGRGDCTAIYYLLAAGERSRWHRVDAIEIWHWYAGAPLLLSVAQPLVTTHLLGNELAAGHRPQVVVPPFAWQAAVPQGAWTLVGCTVAPAFRYEGFELAPDGWKPPS
jgi:predicted cupin superfamily sugar epimerase